jgi:nitrite reductase/ring-hydroxylating ferredoxin subunit
LCENFRFPGIPVGWYTVATSSEVKPGQVVPVKYFGEELILYRTESGEAHLSGAYCPHMGAHLGKGTVEGENLQCPFHGFQFAGDGRCVHAYGKTIPRKAKLDTWPIREHNGFVFAWYHPDRTQPEWDIPVLPGPKEGWTKFRTRAIEVSSHPQETSENSVDVGHFKLLHGFGDAWYEGDLDVQAHLLKGAYGIKYIIPGTKISLMAKFKVEVHGLGYSLVRVQLERFDAEINLLVLSSPVDAENIILRTAASVKNWGPNLFTQLVREAASIGLNREVGQDAPIWETKRYLDKPMLAEGDGPIGEYRRYCKQFYPQQAEAKTAKLPVVAA